MIYLLLVSSLICFLSVAFSHIVPLILPDYSHLKIYIFSGFCECLRMMLSYTELTPRSCLRSVPLQTSVHHKLRWIYHHCPSSYSAVSFFITLIFLNRDVYLFTFYPIKKEIKSSQTGILSLLVYFFLPFV